MGKSKKNRNNHKSDQAPKNNQSEDKSRVQEPEPQTEKATEAQPPAHETKTSSEESVGKKTATNNEDLTDICNNIQLVFKGFQELLQLQSNAITELSEIKQLQKNLNEGMHQDLQEYKLKFMSGLFTPVMKDLLTVYDEIQKMTQDFNEEDTKVKQKFEFLCDKLLGILDVYDVFPMDLDEKKYDLKRHRALERVKTEDKTKHKTICKVFRRGFEKGDQILRPQEVSVYFYQEPEPVKDENIHEL